MYSNNTIAMSVNSQPQYRRFLLYGCIVIAVAGDLKQAIFGSVGRGLQDRSQILERIGNHEWKGGYLQS